MLVDFVHASETKNMNNNLEIQLDTIKTYFKGIEKKINRCNQFYSYTDFRYINTILAKM